MDIKWYGAILIISACGGFGFTLSAAHRREEKSLKTLINILDFMASELHFRGTPLPDLCRMAAGENRGGIGKVFTLLALELDQNRNPDVQSCMESALSNMDIPRVTLENLHNLGNALGRFDLEGQLNALLLVRDSCRKSLEQLTSDREQRLRNYQTISLCAGAALAILLV
jgi:stage III sporulation protein AB